MPSVSIEERLSRHTRLAERLAKVKHLDIYRVQTVVETHLRRPTVLRGLSRYLSSSKATQLRLILPKRIGHDLASKLAAATGVPKQTILDVHHVDLQAAA